jgi:hypothetical protein
VIDKIPLNEIKIIREMIDAEDEGKKSKDGNEFMIETNAEGYNSGRTYYLQADSYAACRDVSKKISKKSKMLSREQTQTQPLPTHSRKSGSSTFPPFFKTL